MDEFNYEEYIKQFDELIEKNKKEAIFDKFKNKIVAISCSYCNEEVDLF